MFNYTPRLTCSFMFCEWRHGRFMKHALIINIYHNILHNVLVLKWALDRNISKQKYNIIWRYDLTLILKNIQKSMLYEITIDFFPNTVFLPWSSLCVLAIFVTFWCFCNTSFLNFLYGIWFVAWGFQTHTMFQRFKFRFSVLKVWGIFFACPTSTWYNYKV